MQQYGQYDSLEADAHTVTKRQFIEEFAFKKIYHDLGLAVSEDERKDMFLGTDIPASIKAQPIFQDPATKTFDKARYLNFLQYIANRSRGEQVIWREFEKELILVHTKSKLSFLIKSSTHYTASDAQILQPLKTPIAARCLYVPYDSIPRSSVINKLTEKDKKAYYAKHKHEYERAESREIAFVFSPLLHSSKDQERTLHALTNLRGQFLRVKRKNVEAFAKLHSDHPEEITVTYTKETLPEFLKQGLKQKKKLIGPFYSGKMGILYRYINPKDATEKGTYTFVKIERQVTVGEETESERFREIYTFVQEATKSKDFKKTAQAHALQVEEETIPRRKAEELGRGEFHKVISYAFSKAKINKPSKALTLKQGHVVVLLKKINKAGIPPYSEVADEIETKIANQYKAKIIKERLEKLMPTQKTLKKIKKKYGVGAFLYEKEMLYFDDNEIAKGTPAQRAIGAAFALKEGARSSYIFGEKGIFIIERLPNKSKQKTTPPAQNKQEKKAASEQEKAIIEEIMDKNNIQDDRFYFYD